MRFPFNGMTNNTGNEVVCLLFLQESPFQFHFSQEMHSGTDRKDDLLESAENTILRLRNIQLKKKKAVILLK